MGNYKGIIFDLDDTLFDTSSQLIGPAITAACKAMLNAGLNGSLPDCVAQYHLFTSENLRKDFFSFIVPQLGLRSPNLDPRQISQLGRLTFLRPHLPPTLELIAGARELLDHLKNHAPLFLVTAGDRETQQAKVAKLSIESDFTEILYVAPHLGERKQQSFLQILNRLRTTQNVEPQEVLCIGNRVDSEIREGNELGFHTCLVRHGEHRGQKPLNAQETPTFMVENIRDIISTCRI